MATVSWRAGPGGEARPTLKALNARRPPGASQERHLRRARGRSATKGMAVAQVMRSNDSGSNSISSMSAWYMVINSESSSARAFSACCMHKSGCGGDAIEKPWVSGVR